MKSRLQVEFILIDTFSVGDQLRNFLSVLATSFAILPSCSVGPAYVAPAIEIPCEWKNDSQKPTEQVRDHQPFTSPEKWWQVFEDDKLNSLEELALENNRTLFIAFERIEESRALMGVAASYFYPQITINPLYSQTRQLTQNYNTSSLSANGGTTSTVQTAALSALPKFFRENVLLYFLPFNFSYEVDLWGKIRDGYDSALYDFRAQQKDYENIMLTLTTDLATAYFQMRSADNQMDLLLRVHQTRQKAFDINKDRYDEQIADYSDVTLAGQELDSVLGQYLEVKRQREVLVNQIAVLTGIPAPEFTLEHLPIQGRPPEIPAGIPSEVLLRRPDLAEADFETKSEHALVKKAYTQFFPSLNLTAAAGLESPVLKYFMTTFARYFMDSAQSNQLVFDGGRTSSELNYQIARFREASGNYQQLVLTAFQEVEDSLANVSSYSEQFTTAEATVAWAKKSYQIYYDRYLAGVSDYINVANTERDLLNYQVILNNIQGYQFVATVQLIKALGGGFSDQSQYANLECVARHSDAE